MKTIFADYNASTQAGDIRLTCPGSQADILARNLHPGQWTWLNDGEVIVGARLWLDPTFGLVGTPDWETVVCLDDEESLDIQTTWAALSALLAHRDRSPSEERRVLQLATLLDFILPPENRSLIDPWIFPRWRARALLFMSKPELSLLEIEEARAWVTGVQLLTIYILILFDVPTWTEPSSKPSGLPVPLAVMPLSSPNA